MAAKTSVYQMVTNRIISELEKGEIPWRKPWMNVYGNTEMQGAFNRVTKKSYSLLNQILLSRDGEYATFNQWKAAGGKIKKGSKSEIVVFWKIFQKEVEKDGKKVMEKIPVLRYYNVFHIDDVEGVEPLERPENLVDNVYSDDRADRIISEYVNREGIDYCEQKSNRAYYAPALDRVVIPCKEQYERGNEFYSTAFHELIHSTGSEKRLNRSNQFAAFGSETYSKEELVAEIGAASILNILGMETPESFGNSAAYVQSWISALQNDNRMIVSAGSKAEKAVRYIFGDNNDPEKESTETQETETTQEATQDQPENQPDDQSVESMEAGTEVSVSDTQPEKKKTRKQNRKVIINRIVSDAMGNKVYANHCESDAGKPSMFTLNGKEYYGYIDGHRIIATTKDYGYEKAENPFRIDQFISDDTIRKINHTNEWFKIVLDREKVAEKKRENRKNKVKNPYIVEIPFDSRTTKYLGMNPSFVIDAMDFVGVDYCYLAFDMRAWSGGTTYKAGVFFVNDDDTEMENICMALPVNIFGKNNKPDQIGSYQPEA